MKYEWNQSWLAGRFAGIQRKLLVTVRQLNDEQLNWRPNPSSNSVSNLILHMKGNIQERIEQGILHQEVQRNRSLEFCELNIQKMELERIISYYFDFAIHSVEHLSTEQLEQKQKNKGNEITNLELLHQCAVHYSEHTGQVVYITKQLLGDKYASE
ncbi:DUF1572 family protein [Paenibacillus periandrae]|uniref:DUF1572 family protein n=1 Tax=Paenibacillus periandrae TaxID=1761741 RepID=UPI001F09EC54|nr:DUF1572 family protein [Paenibacillus periandrae]